MQQYSSSACSVNCFRRTRGFMPVEQKAY